MWRGMALDEIYRGVKKNCALLLENNRYIGGDVIFSFLALCQKL